MPCEFSVPKLSGVECIIQGYTGAHPRPMMINPVSDVSLNGMSSISTQNRAIPVQIRIIRLSPSLSEINPDKNLPAVIPMKKSEPNAAASSLEAPLVPSR